MRATMHAKFRRWQSLRGPVVPSIAVAAVACGGGIGPRSVGSAYEEYTCPAPIGRIVREDCGKQALQYQGEAVKGGVDVAGIAGVQGEYRQTAIREAETLVQVLKDQRVALCNNFNTCKLTVGEYRDEQKQLDDAYIALLALKGKMAELDAEGARMLLAEIRKIREGAQGRGARASASVPAAGADAPAGQAGTSGGASEPGADVEPSRGRAQRFVGIAMGGVGAVSMIAGTLFSVSAASKNAAANERCPNNECADPADVELTNDARRAATIGTIGLLGGGALVAGGVIVFLTAPSRPSGAQARLVVAPSARDGTMGIGMRGSW